MRQAARRILALVLACTLTAGLVPAALASDALGSEIHKYTVPLAPGVDMTGQSLWSATYSDLRTEHYLTYTPADGVRPTVLYGDTITGRATLSAMAQKLEAEGKRVVGGINGDYYVLSTGAPLGIVVTEGVLRSTPEYAVSWGLGFLEDGTAFIGQPELTVTVRMDGVETPVAGGINKARTAQGGYFLLTDEFGSHTMNSQAGVDVILRPVEENLGQVIELPAAAGGTEQPAPAGDTREESLSPSGQEGTGARSGEGDAPEGEEAVAAAPAGTTPAVCTLVRTRELKINSRVTCEVVEVRHTDYGIEIPRGCFVLTVNNRSQEELVNRLAALTEGERVEIDISSPDPRWGQAVTALGGMYKLVSGGEVEPDLDREQAPRSAVGIRPDGSAVFYTIDGRQSGYSVGATLTQVAQRLVELGCVEAVCMDGGGSTTFGVTWPGEESLTVVNRPSEGSARANSNALVLVSALEATGKLDHFYITPANNVLLAGSSLQLQAHAMDSSYFPLEWEAALDWSIHNGDGMVTTNGLFTAGGEQTVTQVTASFKQLSGSTSITVVRTPDKVSLVNEATGAAVTELLLEPNQTVDLKGVSVYRNLAVTSQDISYIWAADPAVGKVDDEGRFTAGPVSGSGYLTVSAGEKSLSIPVTVTGHILQVEDFEAGTEELLTTQTAQVSWEDNLERVRFGYRSARISYDAAGGSAMVGATLPVREGENFFSLWVYGDNSGNELALSAADGTGALTDVPLVRLNFAGWRQVTGALPAGTEAVRGFTFTHAGGETPGAGTVWLDQLTTSNELMMDSDAPVIQLKVSGGQLTATVTDTTDRNLLQQNLSVALDGEDLPFTWDGESARVTAALPTGDEKLHLVSVTASDASGNRTTCSSSFITISQWQEPFADMESHWAQGYTAYLYQQKVVSGMQENGRTVFHPDTAIRRGEMALMLVRWLGLDLDAYAEVELPYADVADIPDWMLPAVRAAYGEGFMRGVREGGQLYAHALREISRAEAMTMLGRIQAKGYPAGTLTFEDADQVPDWALEHIQTLVSRGVVGGFENKVNPNASVKRCEVAKMLVAMM